MPQPGVWPEPAVSTQRYLARPRAATGFRGTLQPRRVLSSPDLHSTKFFKLCTASARLERVCHRLARNARLLQSTTHAHCAAL